MRHWMAILMAALLGAIATTAPGQALKPRGADWEISDAERTRLTERWTEEGRPTLAIIAGGSAETPNDTIADLLVTELRSLLAGMLGPGSVLDPESMSALQRRTAQRIALAAGGVSDELADELRRTIDADLIFTVRLVRNGATSAPVLEVLDNRSGALLAAPSADPIDPSKRRWQVVYASALLKEFVAVYAAAHRPPPVHLFDLYVAGFEDFRDADTVFDIVDDALSERGSVQIDDDVTPIGESNFAATLRIAYEGDRAERVMRRVTRALDQGFNGSYVINPVERSRFRLSAYAYRDVAPTWHTMTDATNESFARDVAARANAVQTIAGGLRLGILVGRGIAEDWPQLELQGVEDAGEGLPYPPAELRTALQDHFAALGFDVRDDAATRDRIQQLARQMDRRGVSALTAEALADADFFDLLAVVALRTDADGTVRVNARLISRSDARLLGGVVGPSLAETRPGAYRVRSDRPSMLARFVAGTLAERFDRHAAQLGRSIDVTMLNLSSGEEFTALRALLEATDGVERVKRAVISVPAGTLEVIVDQSAAAHFAATVDRQLPTLDFSPVIAGATPTTLVIDANPSLNDSPPADADLIQRIDVYPDDFPAYVHVAPPAPAPAAQPTPSAPASSPALPAAANDARTPKPRPNSWALLIGVNEADGANPLRGCVGDAKRLADALINHAGFNADQVLLMTDDAAGTRLDPTAENIMHAVTTIADALGSRDGARSSAQVVVSFSSHGTALAEPGLTGLLARDGKLVILETIRKQFADAGIADSVFIIDACHAGGPNDHAVSQSLQVADQTTLASCRWDETSAELNPPPRGVFTTAVVSGIVNRAADRHAGDGDGVLDLLELYKYAYRVVRHQRRGQQNPFLKLQAARIPVLCEYE